MNKPLRLGPWRHFPGVGWSRTFTHCEVDGAQTTATQWRLWPPVEYEVPPLASGPETGLEGRERADAAARALGWELEGDPSPLPDALRLADLVLAFGRVNRVTRHPDGLRPESDAEHTLMLAFIALTLADQNPEWGLDAGRLAVLALVHDLPEVYAGDTNTAGGLTPSQQADKAAREQAATERLHREFPSFIFMRALTTYEQQDTPEARFLRVLDKVMPKLTHALNYGAALRELGMSVADMQAAHAAQRAKLFAEYPEWDAALGGLFDEAALGAEKAAAEREKYDATVKRVVDELRARKGAVPAVPAAARSCNKHDDCAAADAAAEAAGKPRPYHCTDECCEECFGS